MNIVYYGSLFLVCCKFLDELVFNFLFWNNEIMMIDGIIVIIDDINLI